MVSLHLKDLAFLLISHNSSHFHTKFLKISTNNLETYHGLRSANVLKPEGRVLYGIEFTDIIIRYIDRLGGRKSNAVLSKSLYKYYWKFIYTISPYIMYSVILTRVLWLNGSKL